MSEKSKDERDPREWFLIDTRTYSTRPPGGFMQKNTGRKWRDLDLLANAEYREMAALNPVELREATKDTGLPPHIRSRVANYHDLSHMTPDVVKYETDENGLIWIPKDCPEDAKRIMNSLRKTDKEVDWNPMGLKMTDEELLQKEAPRSTVPQPKAFKK